MKKICLLLTMLLGIVVATYAQTFPQGMNYQAVMRDLDGQVLADQDIGVKITLLGGGVEGKIVYSEVHQLNTNRFGMINLVIGQGNAVYGDMTEVPWSSEEIWLDIALGDDNKVYTSISTTRLLAVPYAFHAYSAEKVGDAVLDSEKVAGPYWKTNGNAGLLTPYQFLGSVDEKDLIFKTNNTERMTILANGNVHMVYDLTVAGNVIASGFYGDGSGLTGIDVRDADHDPTNELQKWSTLPGIPPDIFDGDDVDDADNDPTNELQTWATLPGIPGDILDGDDVDDADNDPTNELQKWTNLPGIPADIFDGDDVDDADNDPTNELQKWTNLPGIPADIFDGDDVDDADNDPTNELQNWTNLPGIPADIFDGDDVDDADNDPTNELELPSGGSPGQVLSISPTGQYIWVDAEHTYTIGYNPQLGGYVFYVTPDGKHGLVAAMQDQAYTSWLSAQDAISNPANHDPVGRNFTDWRLPTKYELSQMYPFKYTLGMSDNYWCSVEQDYFYAWYQNFYYGYQGYFGKGNSYYVRAIRAF